MISRSALIQTIYHAKDTGLSEFDMADIWLKENEEEGVKDAARKGLREYSFVANTAALADLGLGVGILRKVLAVADYGVTLAPAGPKDENGHCYVKFTIKW